MTKAKKIVASTYVLMVLGLLAHDALKPQDVRNINDDMIYNYSVVESYSSIDYAVEYLSSKNGATTSTAVGTDEYFSANSHLLAKASQTRQDDKEQELLDLITAEVKQSEAEDAILAKLTEEVKQAEIAEQEAEERRKAQERAEAKLKAEAQRKAEISSQVQNIDKNSFYIKNIVVDNGSRTLHMDYDHQAYLYKVCQDLDIDYLTAFAMIVLESSCNNDIPYSGYYGYFQMNDGCVKNVRNYYNNQSLDPTNPYDNILIGVTVLKDQVEQTGDLYNGLLAYNKGYYGWLNNPYDTEYADIVMGYRAELELSK